MPTELDTIEAIEKLIADLTAEHETIEQELGSEAEKALRDWLIVEACKDYDNIEREPDVTGKSHRKKFKALRDQKRNTEKIIEAMQALLETAKAPEGEKLRKKFSAEQEKYHL